ncbi:MAG: hypothetical protein CMJ64_20740 [Planctomycetaceae bacterium]|nr:hypothetical protein [Planctomycetaceae bacterium]
MVLFAILLVAAALACWAMNLVGLPGNWFVLLLTVFYAYLVPEDRRVDVGIVIIGLMLMLAILGEAVDFLAGAFGATKAGGSKRGAALALSGSLGGGFLGLFVPIPIPFVGSVIGAILFSGVGALLGAVLGELWKGRTVDESLKVGHAAFWGRLLGTAGKIIAGCWMIALLIIGLIG